MTHKRIAYKRVSTAGQDTSRQLEGMSFDREFIDKVSGSSRERQALMDMLAYVRDGDIITVHSIDRLARNLVDLLELVQTINDKGVTLEFRKEGLTFTGDGSAMQELQLSIMGAVAQFERAIINERAAEGRAIAMSKGVKFGRKPSLTPAEASEVRRLHAAGKSIRALAIDFDVGRSTICRALKTLG